jgi:hypothetical protein
LWLIKLWFSASTFVVKIATFAKPETVIGQAKDDTETNYETTLFTFYNLTFPSDISFIWTVN